MNFVGPLFIIIWIGVMIYILYSLFTKDGRNDAIQRRWKAKIIQDFGIIDTTSASLYGFYSVQKLRLLKLQSETEKFYVLEVSNRMGLSFQVYSIKLNQKSIEALFRLIKE